MSKSIRSFVSFLLVLQLIIPYTTFAAAVGRFTSVVGDVKQTRVKRVIKPVAKSPIQMKDLIATALTSSATMVFSDDSSCTHLQSPKDLYELQEKCGKLSEELFVKFTMFQNRQRIEIEGGNEGVMVETPHGYQIYYYRNHYHKKWDKCFLIMALDVLNKDKKVIKKVKSMLDVNDNLTYGSFEIEPNNVVHCQTIHKLCKSEEEWDLLIKPYMEE